MHVACSTHKFNIDSSIYYVLSTVVVQAGAVTCIKNTCANHRCVRKMILPTNRFTGKIAVGNLCAKISLTVYIDDAGKLDLKIDPITNNNQNALSIIEMVSYINKWQSSARIDCKNARGDRLVSNKLYLKKWRSSEDLSIEIHPLAVRFFIKSEKVYDHSVIRFRVFGLKCTKNVSCETELGLVEVLFKRDNDALGIVQLKNKSETFKKEWYKKSNTLLIRVVNMLGLACGYRVWIPLIEFRVGDRIEFTWNKVNLDQQSDKMKVMNSNSLEPLVMSVIKSNNRLSKKKWDWLGTSINWMLISTTYTEVRFLTTMTALEGLTKFFTDFSTRKKLSLCKIDKRTLPREDFSSHTCKQLERKITSILDARDIDKKLVSTKEIKNMVSLRNKIVHESYASENENADRRLSRVSRMAYEIVTQAIFSIIGFKGSYLGYFLSEKEIQDYPYIVDGERHLRQFPNTN